ncbi:MAG: orotate phosphoribosyltransferase [Bdellovibrionales bacterium]|jgi:orotate phosphoribosyltransferase|nr:orotate phosphoribosyltransferase [Bdellovibrionales bacterium]MBT3525660.1 orotate phosphoribosyltransferase [Bdellovibrionales bacterium]MBT7668712.1 orotate phosphoribosyltransferase [Bdellovibrionales bacterium]MBT7768124.1 orotate phosphoribosyltransferase [Bdellovibrionales bacterium]
MVLLPTKEIQLEVANLLLDQGAVVVSPAKPFTYASGLKGPIYSDNRLLLSDYNVRRRVVQLLGELVRASEVEFKLVAGVATAGIPYGALLAEQLERGMIYLRSGGAKRHGKQNQIEGRYQAGDRVILIEDLINQAGSLESAALAAMDGGLEVTAAFSIVTYQMDHAAKRLAKINLPAYSLTNFKILVEVATQRELIDSAGRELLNQWQQDPSSWSAPI